jgi:hypothetical protein
MIVASYFDGSSSLQTSVANAEIIPVGVSFYFFQFSNDQDCTIKINDSNPIFIRANQGLVSTFHDRMVYSFKIVESGIKYNWIGSR